MLSSRNDAGQENQNAHPGKPGTENSRPQRTVLGEINQNVMGARIQPFRAAKQNATTEGFFSHKPQLSEFKIFDETAHARAVEKATEALKEPEKPSLPAALTALPSARLPLSTLAVAEQEDSPMVLDDSTDSKLSCETEAVSDLFEVSEYAEEIFEHLRVAERRTRPKANYMRKQQDITTNMRSILVDWLTEVSEEYKLHTETTHLAVNYIDRFLSQMAVMRVKLQLVGTAAMFLAAKFEEIYPPDVGEFVYITDDTYTKKQVLRMEHLILKILKFDVAVPTSNQFLPRFLKAAGGDKKTGMLASYICELALIDCDMVAYLPSSVAASAVCLASYAVSGKIWDEEMRECMQYELHDLAPCISKLHSLFLAAPYSSQQAAREKYKEAKMECASLLEMPLRLPIEEIDEP